MAALTKLLLCSRGGIQLVEHAEGDGDKMFTAVCDLGLEDIVSKKLNAPYRSGPSKSWPNPAQFAGLINGTTTFDQSGD